MASNTFVVRSKPTGLEVNKAKMEEVKRDSTTFATSIQRAGNKYTISTDRFSKFDAEFALFADEITKMTLKHDDTNKIFAFCSTLLKSYNEACKHSVKAAQSISDKGMVCDILSDVHEHVSKRFEKCSSRYRRQKEIEHSNMYVQPQTKSIGSQWKTRRNHVTDLQDHSVVDSTLQYISIGETLKKLFMQQEFKDLYFKFNSQKHKCVDGVYKSFCCGSTYKKCAIYRDNFTIQLQLGTDDFDVCDAVKSKNVIHKICAVYFRIINVPVEISSKLRNIFLNVLCNTTDLTNKESKFDKISELIVPELKDLETTGIDIGDNLNLKVGLAYISHDNLGGNGILGFVENFTKAEHYCRICECSLKEVQTLVKEDETKIRKMSTYTAHLSELDPRKKAKYTDSKGFKSYCLFNNLLSYNIFDNATLDWMHDGLEGVLAFFVNQFFEYCIDKKVLDKDKIITKVRDFNYGFLNKRNLPSAISIGSNHLGNNASQIYCIFVHLTLMFMEFKDRLQEIWPLLTSLLRCTQITMSTEITERDLKELEKQIENHLTGLINTLKVKLIPKHHFFTHYARVIRALGPVLFMWMMRFESKHKYFTDLAKKTNNLVNITKTLANRHQEMMFASNYITENEFTVSKHMKCVTECEEFSMFESLLPNACNLFSIAHLTCNSYEYVKNIMLIEDFAVYEIIKILLCKSHSKEYYFLCQKYNVVNFDDNYNAIEIEKSEDELEVINFGTLKNKKPYEKKVPKDFVKKVFILAEDLNVYNSMLLY